MKFGLECVVESKTKLSEEVEIETEKRTYFFYPNDEGYLTRVKVVANVEHPERFSYVVQPFVDGDKTVKNHIFNIDEELLAAIVKDLQDIESILGFWGNVKRIRWQAAKYDFIYDSEAERQKIKLSPYQAKITHGDPDITLEPELLAKLVATKDKYPMLIAPQSFFREGYNDFQEGKYINAFYNFYFILEGLYGNREWRSNKIAGEFKRSTTLSKCIEDVISEVLTEKQSRYLPHIQKMLKQRQKALDIEGVIFLLVATRGDLHHFFNVSSKNEGTPLNQHHFEPIAFVTMSIAQRAIAAKGMELDR